MKRQRGFNGSQNLEARNATAETKNLNAIAQALETLAESGQVVSTLQDLRKIVSLQTGIHSSYFSPKRNPKYRDALLLYLSSQTDAVRAVSSEDASMALLKAKLHDANLRLERLSEKLARLTSRPVSAASNSPDHYVEFQDTAKLLQLVIGRSEGTIELDAKSRLLIDRMAPHSSRIVCGPPRTDAFFRWLGDTK